ncbi:hypothetical protein [Phragmitibacter flavus]|nr:hypothetical protein [Phragmitibacter flavus]
MPRMREHGGPQDREAQGAAVMHPRDGDLTAVTLVVIVVATELSSNK